MKMERFRRVVGVLADGEASVEVLRPTGSSES